MPSPMDAFLEKTRMSQSHRRAGLLKPTWALHGFFLGLVVLVMMFWIWRTLDFYHALLKDFRYRSEISTRSIANQVALELDGHFHDLTFFRRSFLEGDTHPLRLTPRKQDAMIAFQKAHPSIVAINIVDAQGKQVLWSSVKSLQTPLLKNKDFIRLSRNPDYLIGRPQFFAAEGVWVMPMREHLLDHQGRVLGYIGSPFRLSRLRNMDTPSGTDILIQGSHSIPVAFWRNGVWQVPRPDQQVFIKNVVQTPVPGYPWTVYARWSSQDFWQIFWHRALWQSAPFLLIGIIFFVFDRVGVRFLKQWLNLRQYQQAALEIQQSLLCEESASAMYSALVRAIVQQTSASAAWIMALDDHPQHSLRVVAESAEHEALRVAVREWTIALHPDASMSDYVLPAQVFCSGRAAESRHVDEYLSGPTGVPHVPFLAQIRSMMAYPIQIQDEQALSGVLVVVSKDQKHFSPALKSLLGLLAGSLGLALTLLKRHASLTEAELEIRKIAFYDTLTGLPNRRLLDARMEKAMMVCEKQGRSVALGILDIDDFKIVNDRYGHEAGDALLVILARRLEKALRPVDCVARWGGDEFVLLLEDLPDRIALQEVLLRLERELASLVKLPSGELLPVRVSMGVCFCTAADKQESAVLMRRADQALYAAKAQKKDRAHFWVLWDDAFDWRTPEIQGDKATL